MPGSDGAYGGRGGRGRRNGNYMGGGGGALQGASSNSMPSTTDSRAEVQQISLDNSAAMVDMSSSTVIVILKEISYVGSLALVPNVFAYLKSATKQHP